MTAAIDTIKNSQAIQKIAKAMGQAKDFVKGLPGKAKQGLLNIGTKIKDSKVGQTVANSKFGKAVGKFKTDFQTSYKAALESNKAAAAAKTAGGVAKDVGTGAVQTGTAAGAGGAVEQAAKAKKSSLLEQISGVATAGVMAYQVYSANKQYKDSVKRTDAYNAALKAEEDAATAATTAANAATQARSDAYTNALYQGSTSTQNIYSYGGMNTGDSVFSSTLKNSKYTLF